MGAPSGGNTAFDPQVLAALYMRMFQMMSAGAMNPAMMGGMNPMMGGMGGGFGGGMRPGMMAGMGGMSGMVGMGGGIGRGAGAGMMQGGGGGAGTRTYRGDLVGGRRWGLLVLLEVWLREGRAWVGRAWDRRGQGRGGSIISTRMRGRESKL